jgi:hypothetical protein
MSASGFPGRFLARVRDAFFRAGFDFVIPSDPGFVFPSLSLPEFPRPASRRIVDIRIRQQVGLAPLRTRRCAGRACPSPISGACHLAQAKAHIASTAFFAEAKMARLPVSAQRNVIACGSEPVRWRAALSIVQRVTGNCSPYHWKRLTCES